MTEIVVQIVNFIIENPIGTVAIILSLAVLVKAATPLLGIVFSKNS